jgi:hypothetical protein
MKRLKFKEVLDRFDEFRRFSEFEALSAVLS